MITIVRIITVILFITTLLFITTFASCNKDNLPPKPPYFPFDNIASQWLTQLKLNDTLKFISNTGNLRLYKINAIEKIKNQVSDCSWTWGGCNIYFEADQIEVKFARIDSIPVTPNLPIYFSVKMYMWPPDSLNYKNLPKNVIAKARIYGTFEGYNNVSAPPTGLINFPDIYKPLTTFSFSNSAKTYGEVIKINSGNSNALVLGNYTQTINELWFDKKYGFVLFKDVFGNIWSRFN